MRDPMESLSNALDRDEGGVAIVWCPDLGMREWLVGEAESVAPLGSAPLHTQSLDEALAAPERLALVVPTDEGETIRSLDAQRDRLLGRRFPVVLFLLREGDGRRVLAEEAPSLAHWARGNDVDPEALAQVDLVAERQAFVRDAMETPEAWLARWRSGKVAKTSETFRTAYRALLLEAR